MRVSSSVESCHKVMCVEGCANMKSEETLSNLMVRPFERDVSSQGFSAVMHRSFTVFPGFSSAV